ncbi:MAG: hypothetical protein D6743_04975 [Calditrichaeota bacterium]|nr:MAG: hypothetical protein D6743_04975 [Calditrichota bacterium]
MKAVRRNLLAIGFLFGLFFLNPSLAGVQQATGGKLSINLKARTVVLGPEITLGDVGRIVVRDRALRQKLSSVKIKQAPPPGEATDISLNDIKKCLRVAGFGKYVHALRGPRTIRVVTAPVEIDKAFIREEHA